MQFFHTFTCLWKYRQFVRKKQTDVKMFWYLIWKIWLFVTFPVSFWIPIIFSILNYNCSSIFDLRTLQEQVKKTFCFKSSSDLQTFCNFSTLSLEFQKFFLISRTISSHSRSEQFWKQNTIPSITHQGRTAKGFHESPMIWYIFLSMACHWFCPLSLENIYDFIKYFTCIISR